MHGTLENLSWTPERVDLLKRLAADKMSGSAIAYELRITRGAVMGKCWRLGVQLRSVTPTNSNRAEAKKIRARRKGPFMLKVMPPEPNSLNLTFDQLQTVSCRYPVTADAPFLFCGRDRMIGSSYCAHHSFVVTAPRK